MKSNKDLCNIATDFIEAMDTEDHNEKLLIIKLMESIVTLRSQIELTAEMTKQQYQSFIDKLRGTNEPQKH